MTDNQQKLQNKININIKINKNKQNISHCLLYTYLYKYI